MRPQRGFTLIELMIAMALMALITAISWRGMDGLMRVRETAQTQVNRISILQTALAQWRVDLDAVQPVKEIHATGLDWNGQVLRIMRAAPPDEQGRTPGMLVAAWTLRAGQWLRWQSPVLRSRDELSRAWTQAARWAQDPSAQDVLQQVVIAPAQSWQIFYFRDNSWTHPLSSTGSPTQAAGNDAATSTSLPDAVRLQIDWLPNSGLSGAITLDWLRPHFNRTKS